MVDAWQCWVEKERVLEVQDAGLTVSVASSGSTTRRRPSIRDIAAYLQEAVGQRVAAAMAAADAKQIGRYARQGGPNLTA